VGLTIPPPVLLLTDKVIE